MRFYDLATEDGAGKLCERANKKLVQMHTQYSIEKSKLTQYEFRRTGVSFGALVVPFKFRFGDNEIVSSATIAPYAGWRTGLFSKFGLSFTPLISAGIALVPVTDATSGATETKSAFSAAVGFVVGSSKNEAFQSGVLIGRDYLNRADRAADPGARRAWISVYVGYALTQ